VSVPFAHRLARVFGDLFAGKVPGENPDVAELRRYNEEAQRCELCPTLGAHRDGDGVYRCDDCCIGNARAIVDAAERADPQRPF